MSWRTCASSDPAEYCHRTTVSAGVEGRCKGDTGLLSLPCAAARPEGRCTCVLGCQHPVPLGLPSLGLRLDQGMRHAAKSAGQGRRASQLVPADGSGGVQTAHADIDGCPRQSGLTCAAGLAAVGLGGLPATEGTVLLEEAVSSDTLVLTSRGVCASAAAERCPANPPERCSSSCTESGYQKRWQRGPADWGHLGTARYRLDISSEAGLNASQVLVRVLEGACCIATPSLGLLTLRL